MIINVKGRNEKKNRKKQIKRGEKHTCGASSTKPCHSFRGNTVYHPPTSYLVVWRRHLHLHLAALEYIF
jgi:hypothetical protein